MGASLTSGLCIGGRSRPSAIGALESMKHLFSLKAGAACAAIGLSLCSGQAFAADAPAATSVPATAAAPDVIVVTGSRIARPDLKSSSPIAVLSSKDFALTNSVTAESLLSVSPQFVPGITGTTNNGNGGAATIDLRGIGAQRTLVLIDGRRMVPSDIGGAVDINAIPTVLIKRVDILTGGASAVYGADAVAGVVNFVLDDKFKGFTVDASDSVTRYGDAPEQNVGVAAGFTAGDRFHFVIAGQYTHRAGVYQSAREYSAVNLSGSLKPSGSSNTTPTAIDINAGRFQLNDGSQPGAAGDFVPYYKPYNFNPANYLQVPLDRYNVTALASYEVSPVAEIYARGSYTRSNVTAILAPTATAGFNFTISPDNPFLNAANKALIFGDPGNLNADGTANVGIRRRITETGGRIESFHNDVYYGIGGVRGQISPSFSYDVFAQYGLTRRHENLANDLDYNKVSQAINVVAGPGGSPVCADPSGGCVPLNLFTTNPISQQALKFISADGLQDNRYTQFVTGASISGDVAFLKSPLAGKSAAVAGGVEYRSETGSQAVDANYGSGNLIYYGQGTAVPNASFNVKEVYGELKLPLVNDKPLFEELSFEGGVRYSSYTNNTTAGRNKNKATTFKIGGDWTPVGGIRFRAVYNRAIRDPNIFELNAPVTQAGTDVLQTDPCALGRPQGNAALQAICIAQGAPANLVRNGVIQDVIANQTNINSGGNTQLKPEKASTITIGAVISPSQIRGLNITVDYYNIKVKDYIATDGSQDIVNQCFNNNISLYCSAIVRSNITGQLTGSANANGQFPGVSEVLQNIGSLHVQGVDVSLDYHRTLNSNSSIGLSFGGTYTGQHLFDPGGGAQPYTCAGRFGNTCAINPIPRWKHTASVTYERGAFSILGRWRFIGPVSEDAGTNILVSHIPSYSYFDTTASVRIKSELTLRLGVSNIFNIQPPVVGGSAGSSGVNSGNTFPNVYDALGQTFFAGATIKF